MKLPYINWALGYWIGKPWDAQFHALIMVDSATSLVEMQRVGSYNKCYKGRMQEKHLKWISYLSIRVIHDQGTEFMGDNFQVLLRQWSIRKFPISVRSPQANAACERMHQTVNISYYKLWFIITTPHRMYKFRKMWSYDLQMAGYTLRTALRRTQPEFCQEQLLFIAICVCK